MIFNYEQLDEQTRILNTKVDEAWLKLIYDDSLNAKTDTKRIGKEIRHTRFTDS